MIGLELVNKDNFEAVLQVSLAETDERKVASVEYSLAQEDSLCQKVTMHYVIGNHKMRYILEKLGSQSVGLEGQEMKMELIIR
ncbi:TPA: hypothetical protein ACGO7G_000410 [Streptococcus suis]